MARIRGYLYSEKTTNKSKQNELSRHVQSFDDLRDYIQNNNIKSCPLDIETLITSFGIAIIKEDLGAGLDNVSGYIIPNSSGWVICIHQYDSKGRQRFSMAHEFMHYILHKETLEEQDKHSEHILFRVQTPSDRKDKKDKKCNIEDEANVYAAELLMPEKTFIEKYHEYSGDIDALSDVFQVSKHAASYRAKLLNLI